MKPTTVRCELSVGRRRAPAVSPTSGPAEEPRVKRTPAPSRAAQMLALAHHVERLVDAGEITGYAEAARALGLTRARLTQVMNLLLLGPELQERVATGEVATTERSLRAVVGEANWQEQLDLCRGRDQ